MYVYTNHLNYLYLIELLMIKLDRIASVKCDWIFSSTKAVDHQCRLNGDGNVECESLLNGMAMILFGNISYSS